MAGFATPGAGSGLSRILAKPNYDPENFVNKQAQGGIDQLLETKKNIQLLSEETSVALKKNVYKNYSQFIETAKEISALESEMYQLSHMLMDQKSVMTEMMETSITGNKVEEEAESALEDDLSTNLAYLLENVEGCSSVTEVPGRYLVHDSDLLELDDGTFAPIERMHLFLLNDTLMMTTWMKDRRGPVRYCFESLYELDDLSTSNIRDSGTCKNAFKLFIFPKNRVFQAESPKSKRQWLDTLEEIKRQRAQRKEVVSLSSTSDLMRDRLRTMSVESNNPFADEIFEENKNSPKPAVQKNDLDLLSAPWLQDLPENLDVCIAQRDFEGAVDLINRVNDHLKSCPKTAPFREYKSRIDYRAKELTEVLTKELRVNPERSLRGGPRAARQAVTQLIRLGKSAQACDLFLKNRSAIAKHTLRQLKVEGASTLYIKRLCQTFFETLLDTGREFIKAFSEYYGCFSSFLVWAKGELAEFVTLFISQVFVAKTTLSIVAECVSEARKHCDQLQDIGLELTFVMEGLMKTQMDKLVRDSLDVQMDALRHRASSDMWRPVNFQNLDGIEKFEAEIMAMGIMEIHNYTYDEHFTMLTANVIHFTRSLMVTVNDLLRVYTQDLHSIVSQGIVDLLLAQLRHADKSIKKLQFKDEQKYILQNACFLVEVLLPVLGEKYSERTGFSLPHSSEFNNTLKRIKKESAQTLGEFV